VTIARASISPADKQSALAAYEKAERQFSTDKDIKKLSTPPAGLSRDAERLYRARASRRLSAQKNGPTASAVNRPETAGAVYAILSGTVSGYVEVDCSATYTVDLVYSNRGVAAPPPQPAGGSFGFGMLFAYVPASGNSTTPLSATLAPRATGTFRFNYTVRLGRLVLTGVGDTGCNKTVSGGWAAFAGTGIGDLTYEISIENTAFFIREVE